MPFPMLLVKLDMPSPRGFYVIRHMLEGIAGISIRLAESDEEFRSATGPKLNYGSLPFADAFNVPRSGALDRLPVGDPEATDWNGMRVLFPIEQSFDVFAASFFFLSLADEIRCPARDRHGRVPSKELYVVRKGFADEPWVDRWAMHLGRELERRWPGIITRKRRYSHIATVDMDNVLRYAGRPLHRAFVASAKDLLRGAFSAVSERWLVRFGGKMDPYIEAVDRMIAQRDHVDRAILFYLMRGDGPFDHAADVAHPSYRGVFGRAGKLVEVGLHPSYGSSGNEALHIKEQAQLQNLVPNPVRVTRQHFLRWRLPETLRFLSDQGYTEDHTLGFTDRIGFRASTCTPFHWYDMQREEETGLWLYPFAAMDSALIEQLKLDEQGVERSMMAVSDSVRSVNGTFVSVWHDRYLSGHREFAPWPVAFDRVIRYAKS